MTTVDCKVKPYGRRGTSSRRIEMRTPSGEVVAVEYVQRGESEIVTHDRLLARIMASDQFQGVVGHSGDNATVTLPEGDYL